MLLIIVSVGIVAAWRAQEHSQI